jgi:type I restriction enzyme M protein
LKKQRENPDDILFVDASAHFQSITNQNFLRSEDIDRIVNAYRKRESVKKFSHVAELREIEKNDYNLNIPRYVDTFEEEPPIDLAEVTEKLAALEDQMAPVEKEIAAFCDALSIPRPF